jgi:hypothetical protein
MKTPIRGVLATPQGGFGSLQIAKRLAPPIFKDDHGERHTANRPEPSGPAAPSPTRQWPAERVEHWPIERRLADNELAARSSWPPICCATSCVISNSAGSTYS